METRCATVGDSASDARPKHWRKASCGVAVISVRWHTVVVSRSKQGLSVVASTGGGEGVGGGGEGVEELSVVLVQSLPASIAAVE